MGTQRPRRHGRRVGQAYVSGAGRIAFAVTLLGHCSRGRLALVRSGRPPLEALSLPPARRRTSAVPNQASSKRRLCLRLLPEVPSPHHLDGHDDGRRHDGQRLPLVENPIREPPRAVTPEWGDNPRTSPKPSDCGRHQFGAPRQRFDELAIDLPGSDIAKQRRGDDDIIRVGTASALCLHCTPPPGRPDALYHPVASQTRTIDYVFY